MSCIAEKQMNYKKHPFDESCQMFDNIVRPQRLFYRK